MQTFYLIIIARSLCKLEYKLKQLQTGESTAIMLCNVSDSVVNISMTAWRLLFRGN